MGGSAGRLGGGTRCTQYEALIGDQWFDEQSSLVLKVHSTVIPVENNFVINTSHPDFNELQIGDIQL